MFEKFNTPQTSLSNPRTCFLFITAFPTLMPCDSTLGRRLD